MSVHAKRVAYDDDRVKKFVGSFFIMVQFFCVMSKMGQKIY